MGADNSVLEGCEWEETVSDGLWCITHGKLSDGTEISRFTAGKKDKHVDSLLRKLIKNLKSIRHPSVLTYMCSEEEVSSAELITERALPLESVLQSLTCTELCAGLHTILDALHFLHEKVGASHNNVHIGSVYVTSDSSWRLGGLEHLCKFSEATDNFLDSCKTYRDEAVVTPEEKEGKVSTDSSLGHARDVYAFAVMAESLLEHMEDLGDLTKTFELRIQDECLNSDPRKRPKVQSLLCDRLFNTEFLEIALFLKSITLKTEEERTCFFKNLVARLQTQPAELVARRLVPGLLSRFVFLDQSAVEYLLPSLLTPRTDESSSSESLQPLLSETLYKHYVVPKLVKIFSVHDYHIHLLLLQYFHCFVHLIDRDNLEFDVFPQVLLGLRDSSELIASLSLHALAEMVPVLGRDVVIGGKSKKYFREGRPKSHSQDTLPTQSHSQDAPPTVNNKQSNVHGVMGKIKLLDLAKQSEKNFPAKLKVEDAEQKWKEREQRKEEMRRKREEMRRKREETKLARLNSKIEPGGILNSLEIQPESPDRSHEKPYIIDTVGGSPADNSRQNSPEPDKLNTNSDSVEYATEKSSWSDWSGDDIDTDYSEEVERELESMPVDAAPTEATSSLEDNLNISKHSKGSAMKLASHKSSGKQKSQSICDKIEGLEVSKDNKSATVNSKIKFSGSSQQKLGSEFDIMDLDIKVNKEQDFDYFADMTPVIKPKTDPVSLAPSHKISGNKSSNEVQQKFTMEIQNTELVVDDTGGGWGDDDDDW